MNLQLKKGITTGTAATAASKAIVIKLLKGASLEKVPIKLPLGDIVEIPVKVHFDMASCQKWSIEPEDVTKDIEIIARAQLNKKGIINIIGGQGIGIVTKRGLQIPVGEKAINPVPKKMIRENIYEILGSLKPSLGVDIYLEVPEGEKIAKKTFNERLGIIGGISIIGTKGIINPMSEDALRQTVKCEIDVRINEKEPIALTPGNIGEQALFSIGIKNVVIVNNYFDFALQYLTCLGIKRIIIGGHPGKLAKLAYGIYYTHSKSGIKAVQIIKTFLGCKGEYSTAEEMAKVFCLDKIAYLISERIKRDFPFEKVSIFLFTMDGQKCGEFIDE